MGYSSKVRDTEVEEFGCTVVCRVNKFTGEGGCDGGMLSSVKLLYCLKKYR